MKTSISFLFIFLSVFAYGQNTKGVSSGCNSYKAVPGTKFDKLVICHSGKETDITYQGTEVSVIKIEDLSTGKRYTIKFRGNNEIFFFDLVDGPLYLKRGQGTVVKRFYPLDK